MMDVSFEPPIVVRYDHYGHRFSLSTAGYACADRFISVDGPIKAAGWKPVYSYAGFEGECTIGESSMLIQGGFSPLLAGEALEWLSFEFVVPQTYGTGEPLLPAELPLLRASFATSFFWGGGHTRPDDPPIWPGTYPDSLASDSVLSFSRGRR